jgi:hypothetical protein
LFEKPRTKAADTPVTGLSHPRFRVQAEPAFEPTLTGGREQGLSEQGVPDLDPIRVVVAIDRGIGISEDAEGCREDVLRGEATALVACCEESPMAPQVLALLVRRPMMTTVELVQHPSSTDQQVTPGDHPAVGGDHLMLRLDLDPAHDVEDAKEALEYRLRASVHQGYSTAQQGRAASPESGDVDEFGPRDVTGVKGSVSEENDVEQGEIPSTCQDRLGGIRNPDPVDELPRRKPVVSAHVKARSRDAC